MVTFYEKLQAHVGGLVRVNHNSRRTLVLRAGEIGMIFAIDPIIGTLSLDKPGTEFYAWVTLLTDGNIREGILCENEVEFLQEPG